MQNKKQLLYIGGGLSFKDESQLLEFYKNKNIDEKWNSKSWRDWLFWSLEDLYETIKIDFPAKDNSNYIVWKIIFEKYFAKFNDKDLFIISYSLGTIFILKYLIENGLMKKIKELHLIAPIVSNEFQPANDPENTGSFTFDIDKISEIEKYCDKVYVWHSTDDAMCDYKNAEFIKGNIPNSTLSTFTDRGHFSQSTFFELFDHLRQNI